MLGITSFEELALSVLIGATEILIIVVIISIVSLKKKPPKKFCISKKARKFFIF